MTLTLCTRNANCIIGLAHGQHRDLYRSPPPNRRNRPSDGGHGQHRLVRPVPNHEKKRMPKNSERQLSFIGTGGTNTVLTRAHHRTTGFQAIWRRASV